jgi:murein DD-endopeptidase MepM/ murein hydrolase activator NlpD
VIILLIVSFPVTIFGKDVITQKKEELKSVKEKLDVQKFLVEQTKKKERNLVWEINNLDQEIERISTKVDDLEKHLAQILVLRKEAERRLFISQKNLKASRSRLAERLYLIYRYGNASYIELLLGADDPYDFLTRYKFLSQLAKEDALLLKSVQEEVESVKTWREELEIKEKEIKTTRDELLMEQKSLASKKEERNRLLAQTVSQRVEYERALRELEESSRTLESLIRRLQQTTQGPGLVGNLFWPAASHIITSPFGYRIHPIWGIRMYHTGVDISGSYGDNIYAVSNGRVIYSGWQSGYGKVIVVDHGNGMSTLYAHCSQLLVKEGDFVKRGEIIGKIGATGWATGPHLHFEVRKNGTPINPLSVVK